MKRDENYTHYNTGSIIYQLRIQLRSDVIKEMDLAKILTIVTNESILRSVPSSQKSR